MKLVKGSRPPMTCDVCGKKRARLRRVIRSCGRGKDTLLIENVPAVSCPDCAESYLTARTMHEIERLRRRRGTLAVRKTLAVVRFA